MEQKKSKDKDKHDEQDEYDYPTPIDPNYLILHQVHTWNSKIPYDADQSSITPNQVWTQVQQNMYELQVIAKENHVHPSENGIFENPFPQ